MKGEDLEQPDTWTAHTFGGAEWGDLRRTDRLARMATARAENPSASLPERIRNGSDTGAGSRH
jgi:hypothetical protein